MNVRVGALALVVRGPYVGTGRTVVSAGQAKTGGTTIKSLYLLARHIPLFFGVIYADRNNFEKGWRGGVPWNGVGIIFEKFASSVYLNHELTLMNANGEGN
jgi:hypothetical protein